MLLTVCSAPRISCLRRVRRSGRDNLNTMNSAVRGRRLACPARIALAIELGADLDGAWWPRAASVVRELPELIAFLSTRLGQILDISVNWSSFEAVADLDSLNLASTRDPGRLLSHQRLMMITGNQASANLLVVPCRTSSVLALMVLRQAATLPVIAGESDTQAFRFASDIVRAARAESAVCARRLRNAGRAEPTNNSRAIDNCADMGRSAPAATGVPSLVSEISCTGAGRPDAHGEVVAAQSTSDSCGGGTGQGELAPRGVDGRASRGVGG